ncbi:hypothetical protein E4U34_007196 [Claviceps purpurea]|nr:hypothetical protein E4U37_003564 [Claviceps purpurea]KAG6230934.1 hypothetical protein E4U34_007196 [Claviceps purpurea]KAG6232461.1 hypothetical protein E4U26_005075 [Claviceps purpurea]KAG6243576.1 hypothetical protein E4U25_000422 [Claviceps purpurea]KAG6251865.1 hypothetical protein E4U23_000225 [Claviceps purpurea]
MHELQSRSRRSQPSEPRDFLLAGFVADRTCATWHENGQHVIVQAHAWWTQIDTKRTTFQLEFRPRDSSEDVHAMSGLDLDLDLDWTDTNLTQRTTYSPNKQKGDDS